MLPPVEWRQMRIVARCAVASVTRPPRNALTILSDVRGERGIDYSTVRLLIHPSRFELFCDVFLNYVYSVARNARPSQCRKK
jgi:hypothetical protein